MRQGSPVFAKGNLFYEVASPVSLTGSAIANCKGHGDDKTHKNNSLQAQMLECYDMATYSP